MSKKWIQFGTVYKKNGKVFMTINKKYAGGVNAGDILNYQAIDDVYANLIKSGVLSEADGEKELAEQKERGVIYRVSKAPEKD